MGQRRLLCVQPLACLICSTGDDCILEREPLEALAATGELMAYRHPGFFFAMDTYREYKLLNELWANGDAPWKVW